MLLHAFSVFGWKVCYSFNGVNSHGQGNYVTEAREGRARSQRNFQCALKLSVGTWNSPGLCSPEYWHALGIGIAELNEAGATFGASPFSFVYFLSQKQTKFLGGKDVFSQNRVCLFSFCAHCRNVNRMFSVQLSVVWKITLFQYSLRYRGY